MRTTKLDPVLDIFRECGGCAYDYRRMNGVSSFFVENDRFIKAMTLSLSREKDSEIIGMVLICAKELHPANRNEINLANYEFRSQLNVHFQEFIRGNWKTAPPKRPPFKLSDLADGGRSDELREVAKIVFQKLDGIQTNEEFIAMVDDCPRFIYRHKFMIRWLIAVWKGEVDPDDEEENARLKEAVSLFNERYKRFESTDGITYTPGQRLPTVEGETI